MIHNGKDDHYLIPDKTEPKDKTKENGRTPPQERNGTGPDQIETSPELPTSEPAETEEQVLEVEKPLVNGKKPDQ